MSMLMSQVFVESNTKSNTIYKQKKLIQHLPEIIIAKQLII